MKIPQLFLPKVWLLSNNKRDKISCLWWIYKLSKHNVKCYSINLIAEESTTVNSSGDETYAIPTQGMVT
jgi:hypothetical protein